jgi:DNA transformation protein
MAVDPDFVEHVIDLFSGLGPIGRTRMFSGVGLYAEGDAMFAMITANEVVWMKSDTDTEAAFLAAGSRPFTYDRATGTREVRTLMSLPESAMDDPDEALSWARLSLPPARAAAEAKRRQKARKAARAG